MSLITTLARLEAVDTGRAQPLATVRHRHLTDRPLVLVPLTTAGEAGAPLGALVGTDREAPRLLAVAQPRDRDLRFAFLAELAEAVLPHIEAYADVVEPAERNETDPATGKKTKVEVELCTDAAQVIVPSRAGVEFVRLLGRSMRFRRTAEDDPDTPYPAPARVPLLGRWLTHYGERARVPGSSLLPAVTDLLNRHWATGQSSLEDQHLGALLAWIDPPTGSSGAEAALRAELARDGDGQLLCPPAGPATDPDFDNRLLAPAIERYDRARTALASAEDGLAADARLGELSAAEREIRSLLARVMLPTWDAVWRGLDLLRELPEGSRAEDRWTRDRWSFTAHRDRVRSGEPPQPRRDDAVTAAQKLASRETAQAQLEAQEALDDPLVLAGRLAGGRGVPRHGVRGGDGVHRVQAALPAPAGHRPHGRASARGRADEGLPLAGGQAADGGVRAVRGRASGRRRGDPAGAADPGPDGPGQGARARFGAGARRADRLDPVRARPARRPEAAGPGGDAVDPRRPAGRGRRDACGATRSRDPGGPAVTTAVREELL